MPFFYEFFAGGGMARAGLTPDWQCIFANDFDKKKANSYLSNWGEGQLLVADVAEIVTKQIPGKADLVWASFPCQDLSLAGAGAGLDGKKSGTFWSFWKLMKGLKKEKRSPPLIILENVYGAITSKGGDDFKAIYKAIIKENYVVGACIIDASLFVPQSRPRLFIIAVRDDLYIPKKLTSNIPCSSWHPDSMVKIVSSLENFTSKWLWFNLPEPEKRIIELTDIIELEPKGVEWHTSLETKELMSLMCASHLEKVNQAKLNSLKNKKLIVGTIYKRTRGGVQRAEVRFDGISGCLRTPSGGSSRQTIMIVDGNKIRTRLLSPREAARLMGLNDSYVLPNRYNEAYHLAGDGLVVPVVKYLSQHILKPILKVN